MTIERVVTPSTVFCAKWQLAVKREASNRESWTTISVIDVSLSPDPTESPRASRLVHSHFNEIIGAWSRRLCQPPIFR